MVALFMTSTPGQQLSNKSFPNQIMEEQLNLDWDSRFLAPIDIVRLQNAEHPLSPHTAPLNQDKKPYVDFSSQIDSEFEGQMSNQQFFLQSPVSNYNKSPPLQLQDMQSHDISEIPMPLHFAGPPSFADNHSEQMSNVYQMMDAEGNIQWVNADINPMSNLSPAMQRVQNQLRHSNSETSLSSWTSQQSQFNNGQWPAEQGLEYENSQLFNCTFPGCNKQFNKQTNLKSHIRIHNTERSFMCNECGSAFRRSHDLKRHQRSLHSDVKPYGCHKCGKRFSRMVPLTNKDALKRHSSRVTSACFQGH